MSRAYEDPAPRRAARRDDRRRTSPGCLGYLLSRLGRVVAVLLAFIAIIAVLLYFMPVSLFMVEPQTDLSLTADLPATPFNILVLGVDNLQDGKQRSDTMIIASIDSGTLKLTSLERDVLVEIDDHGLQKLNAAYTFGGPELAMKKVNELYGMNITRYVVLDFTCLVRLVDAIGGIDVTITSDEMTHINKNVLLSRKVFQPLGYTATELKVFGERTHLDGLQALGYARIRKLDSDLRRMQRQRIVIQAIVSKLRRNAWMLWRDARFLSVLLGNVTTNLNPIELVSLGEKALLAESIGELRLPVDGSYTDNGSRFTITDRSANIKKLYSFLYGTSS